MTATLRFAQSEADHQAIYRLRYTGTAGWPSPSRARPVR